MAKYVGHFTSYALNGGTGEIRWKHEPGDFETKQEHNEVRFDRRYNILYTDSNIEEFTKMDLYLYLLNLVC